MGGHHSSYNPASTIRINPASPGAQATGVRCQVALLPGPVGRQVPGRRPGLDAAGHRRLGGPVLPPGRRPGLGEAGRRPLRAGGRGGVDRHYAGRTHAPAHLLLPAGRAQLRADAAALLDARHPHRHVHLGDDGGGLPLRGAGAGPGAVRGGHGPGTEPGPDHAADPRAAGPAAHAADPRHPARDDPQGLLAGLRRVLRRGNCCKFISAAILVILVLV